MVRSAISPLSLSAALTGLILGSLPSEASAFWLHERGNDYQGCTASLIEDGISADRAASACAAALEPTDISECVDEISTETAIAPDTALTSCTRVRRPEEMAACVTRIDVEVESAIPLEVLDYCTRSLLPDDYADCVVGIDSETDFGATEVLRTCIAADYRLPVVVYPDFEPVTPEPVAPVEEVAPE
ncbi:MAG: hypothetical protein WBA57_18300 [Elainellaceae cyanobacterium]